MSCYYLIASLPRLMFDERPLLSIDDFKERCREALRPGDAATVDRLCHPTQETMEAPVSKMHPFEVRWLNSETQLRNAVARVRAVRRGRDASSFMRSHEGFEIRIETAVEQAFEKSSPLEREQALDGLRWTLLEELAGLDPFALSVVLAYAVKLRLAWKTAQRDAGKGMEQVENRLEEPSLEGTVVE